MTVTELLHGRGTPISIHELTVEIPLFNAYRARTARREADELQAEQDEWSRRI
jgi:hypothetical protein